MNADRQRLVVLVEKLMSGGYATETEDDAALAEFEAGVPHPRASGLIYYPDNEFDHEPTAVQLSCL